jgi:tetratricopeptide (TPR) repeat protein
VVKKPTRIPKSVAQPRPATPALGRPTGGRRWLYRLAAGTVVPLIVLALLEISLRLCGYGHATAFFIWSGLAPGGPGYVSNFDFGRRFFPPGTERAPTPLAMPMAKPAGTYRLYVLGESAAQGFPDPATSFSRILEVLLQQQYPAVRFDVINTAMTAINSHVILPVACECAGYRPDVFITYIGNNEVVGPFGAANVIGSYSPSLRLIRANVALESTRFGQLLTNITRTVGSKRGGPEFWGGMEMFTRSQVGAGDPALQSTYVQFRQNLTDICRAGLDVGARMVVCTVPVNLKDCTPFASRHAPGLTAERLSSWNRAFESGTERETVGKYAEAVTRYEDAARIDDGFAELQFRLGRCYAALGRIDEARVRYSLARDLDTVRFRADSIINETTRQVAIGLAGDGVCLVDVEGEFASSSADGTPGEDLFLEHVHLNFHGNYRLAQCVLHKLREVLPLSPPAQDEPSEQTCAERLAYTGWDEYQEAAHVREMFRQPPFTNQFDAAERDQRWEKRLQSLRQQRQPEQLKTTLAKYQQATRGTPGDWMIGLRYGKMLAELGQVEKAIEQFREIVQRHPYLYAVHDHLGRLLLQARKPAEARVTFKAALTAAPGFMNAQYGLADVLAAEGNVQQAIDQYAALVQQTPDRANALVEMANFLNRVGRATEARERLEEAVQIHPDDPQLRMHLGNAWAKAGSLEGAIDQFETALRLRPKWPEAAEHLARLKKLRDERRH